MYVSCHYCKICYSALELKINMKINIHSHENKMFSKYHDKNIVLELEYRRCKQFQTYYANLGATVFFLKRPPIVRAAGSEVSEN